MADYDDGSDRSYYHGRISRDEAVERLQRDGVDGSFLLRMSTSQEGVYTLSVLQGSAVRHIRVINCDDGGYALSQDDDSSETVWDLIQGQMNTTLTNTFNSSDAIALRYPLVPEEKPIAPDLLNQAGEAGMDAAEFDDDVAAFLEGGVDAKTIARRRSKKYTGGVHKSDMVRGVLGGQQEDPDLERFLNGALSADELRERRERQGSSMPDFDNIPEGYFPEEAEQ